MVTDLCLKHPASWRYKEAECCVSPSTTFSFETSVLWQAVPLASFVCLQWVLQQRNISGGKQRIGYSCLFYYQVKDTKIKLEDGFNCGGETLNYFNFSAKFTCKLNCWYERTTLRLSPFSNATKILPVYQLFIGLSRLSGSPVSPKYKCCAPQRPRFSLKNCNSALWWRRNKNRARGGHSSLLCGAGMASVTGVDWGRQAGRQAGY